MTISANIDFYIKNSLINGKVCRFNKPVVNFYIQAIAAPIANNKKEEYYMIINDAAKIWNKFSPIKFNRITSPQTADIIILWTKVGIKFEGMCKFPSIVASEIRKVTIEIGLSNEKSPKEINNQTILHTALHEFGHAIGLGHGINENDLMYVPHTKTLNLPSENDIFVLKTLYKNPIGTTFLNLIK